MSVLRGTSRLSDEVLETIFCEAEAVVNGRPLTKLSDDPNDGSPLTPNHLLLLKQGSVLPPGCFNSGDMYRRRWRHVQSLADQFWSKWRRLYLPELIRQLTHVSAWNHVCSKDNPADYLTRSKITLVRQLDSFWFEGPMWLRSYKCQWPKQSNDFKLNPGDPEIKSAAVTLTDMGIPSDSSQVLGPEVLSVESEMGASPLDVAAASSDACLPAVEECNEMQTISSMSVVKDSVAGHKADSIREISKHYSDWYKMQRGLAWWLRFIQCLKDKDFRGKGRLTVAEINRAKLLLIKSVQRCSYPAELNKLEKGNEVNKSSPLRCLKPFLDSDGVMCVGGRMPDHHPYIIPHDHPCARAIAWHYHGQAHAGAEWTLTLLRDEFWIVRARPLVRKIVRSCITCRRSRAKPLTQLMADLPEERLKSDKPAFSYIGIDVFGPLTVKNYRSEIKRYGCLFTCMTMRAVHVEKLNSLDADSFINAFRRFIARRGIPERVFSDNGTNLVAGEKELRHAFKEILASPKLNAYSVTKGENGWRVGENGWFNETCPDVCVERYITFKWRGFGDDFLWGWGSGEWSSLNETEWWSEWWEPINAKSSVTVKTRFRITTRVFQFRWYVPTKVASCSKSCWPILE